MGLYNAADSGRISAARPRTSKPCASRAIFTTDHGPWRGRRRCGRPAAVELRARARGAMPTFGPSAAAAAATEVRLPGVSVLALTRAWTLSAPWAWACLALIRRIQLNSQRQGAGDPGGGAGGLWSCSEQTETSETMRKPSSVSVSLSEYAAYSAVLAVTHTHAITSRGYMSECKPA